MVGAGGFGCGEGVGLEVGGLGSEGGFDRLFDLVLGIFLEVAFSFLGFLILSGLESLSDRRRLFGCVQASCNVRCCLGGIIIVVSEGV